MTDNLDRIAFREAARAVAYYALWRPFEYVTIIPSRKYGLGYIQPVPFPPDANLSFEGDYHALVGDNAVICLAGLIADRHYRGEHSFAPNDVFDQLTSDDEQTIARALEQTTGRALGDDWLEGDFGPALNKLLGRAMGIVVDFWGRIEAVALALLEEKTITAARVYEVITTRRLLD
jgi:hypothetical protein